MKTLTKEQSKEMYMAMMTMSKYCYMSCQNTNNEHEQTFSYTFTKEQMRQFHERDD